jgi:hypothetical protein
MSGIWPFGAQEEFEQCRFAAASLADDRNKFTFRNVQLQPGKDGMDIARLNRIRDAYVFEADKRHIGVSNLFEPGIGSANHYAQRPVNQEKQKSRPKDVGNDDVHAHVALHKRNAIG